MVDADDDLDEATYRAQSTEDLISSFEFLSVMRARLLHDTAYAAEVVSLFKGSVDVGFCDRRIALINQILLERLPLRGDAH